MGVVEGGKATSLTPAEVARFVNVSKATVLNAIKAGELQAWRPAKNIVRIQPEAVREWMNKMSNTKATRTTTLRALEGGRR